MLDDAEAVGAEIARLELFGSFDPDDVKALAEKGVFIKLYRASVKSVLPLPEGVTAQEMATLVNVDIRAGRSARAQTVGVLCGFGEEAELRRMGADEVLQDTTKLLGLLE